jgi:hypothetical protein
MKLRVLTLSLSLLAVSAAGILTAQTAFADETVKEKAKEVANDTKRGVKKGARAVEDKACEMVNGKMECAAKKVKHSIQNGADNVEDAID